MPKKSDEPLAKHTLHLYRGDFAELQEMYPDVGAAGVIRTLVRKHIKEQRPKMEPKFKVKL